MAERASVVEAVQVGLEATLGTLVAANKRLSATTIRLNPMAETDEFAPEGQKDVTLVTEVAEWSEAAIEGRLTYDEFAYLLSAHYGVATSRAITDAGGVAVTGAFGYEWTATQSTLDVPKTLTIERGSAYRAFRAGGGVVKDLGYTLGRRGGAPAITGALIGQRIEDGVTLTAAPTQVVATPVQSPQIDIYLNATAATVGTTKLARSSKVEWARTGKFADYWILDSAKPSWVDAVEAKPDASLTLTVQADASGMGLLTNLRAGSTVFIRVEAKGPQLATTAAGWKIGGGATITGNASFLFRHDIACKVREMAPIEDQDGVIGGAWPMRIVYDATLGYSERLTLVNNTAAL